MKNTITILTDLDETLLTNSMETFLPVYLQALGNYLEPIPSKIVIQEVLAATEKMVVNQSPSYTLEEMFDLHFYAAIGTPKTELLEKIDSFYNNEFPSLRKYTSVREKAIQFIENAFSNGHQISVATNPLFPKTATFQRLEWAELPVEKYPFEIISTYEDFHFAKPNPAYYAELLGQLGWPAKPVVMVGNSYEDDILPASLLNLPTYWINEDQNLSTIPDPQHTGGSIEELDRWLEEISGVKLDISYKKPESILAVLKSTPAAISTMTKRLSDTVWRTSPDNQEWSIIEVIAHVLDVDREVNLPRIQKILSEENPFLIIQETDKWAKEKNYRHLDIHQLMRDFLSIREELIDLLNKLDEKDWHRSARHAIFGRTSLLELVGIIATHDQTHVRQLKETLDVVTG